MATISNEGNWAQLRQLVLRLLEEHEEVLDQLSALVQGSPGNKGVMERIAVVEQEICQLRARFKVIEKKFDSFSVAEHKKKDPKVVAALVGIVSALAYALGKLVDLAVDLVAK